MPYDDNADFNPLGGGKIAQQPKQAKMLHASHHTAI